MIEPFRQNLKGIPKNWKSNLCIRISVPNQHLKYTYSVLRQLSRD